MINDACHLAVRTLPSIMAASNVPAAGDGDYTSRQLFSAATKYHGPRTEVSLQGSNMAHPDRTALIGNANFCKVQNTEHTLDTGVHLCFTQLTLWFQHVTQL